MSIYMYLLFWVPNSGVAPLCTLPTIGVASRPGSVIQEARLITDWVHEKDTPTLGIQTNVIHEN